MSRSRSDFEMARDSLTNMSLSLKMFNMLCARSGNKGHSMTCSSLILCTAEARFGIGVPGLISILKVLVLQVAT